LIGSLEDESDEISEESYLSSKQVLPAYSIGVGNLKDILGGLSPWMKSIFSLIKESLD
jgi:hypothetical protein